MAKLERQEVWYPFVKKKKINQYLKKKKTNYIQSQTDVQKPDTDSKHDMKLEFLFRMTECPLLWLLCVLIEHKVQILLLLKSMTKLPLTSAVQDQTLSNTANICFLAFSLIFQWKILEQIRTEYWKKLITINRIVWYSVVSSHKTYCLSFQTFR